MRVREFIVPHESSHKPAAPALVPAPRICRGIPAAAWLGLLLAPAVGGCSMSFPMSSMLPASDDVTGSLSKVPFGHLLDEEDRRREKAALATALDPQGEGSTVHWENPKTTNKGAFTPVGHAYPLDSRICRAFIGEMRQDGAQRTIHGTACTIAAGDWEVRDMKLVRKAEATPTR